MTHRPAAIAQNHCSAYAALALHRLSLRLRVDLQRAARLEDGRERVAAAAERAGVYVIFAAAEALPRELHVDLRDAATAASSRTSTVVASASSALSTSSSPATSTVLMRPSSRSRPSAAVLRMGTSCIAAGSAQCCRRSLFCASLE